MKFNKYILMPVLLIVFSIAANLFLGYYIIPKRSVGLDQVQHFYDMKKWYESGKFPTTSQRFTATEVINEEFTTARVPGGAYYIFYTLFYKLANENLLGAKTINFIFNLIIIYIFLFWFYKRFGLFLMSIVSSIILCNIFFVMAVTDFWNPSVDLIFSFLVFMFLFEYIDNNEENGRRKNIVRFSAIIIFPLIAVMAQTHFFVFFSLVPTIIIYLLIKFKRTLKYIPFLILGVFLSFLQYVPYLLSEMQTNFSNLNMMFETRAYFTELPFPQLQGLFIFPTNDISYFSGAKMSSTIRFWKLYPITWLGVLFLLISLIFNFICFIRAIYYAFNKKYISSASNNEKILIDMIRIFFLFIPITIIGNLLVGQFAKIHYLFQVFSFSFLPIIFFFVQKEKKKFTNKFLYSSFIILFINIFVLSLELIVYNKNYQESSNVDNTKILLEALYNDTKNEEFSVKIVYNADYERIYRDIAKTYFTNIILNQVDNSTNLYIFLNMIGASQRTEERISNDMEYINKNTLLITNVMDFYLYKYIGKEPFERP